MGSVPNGVIEIFQLLDPSGRTMSLGSTQLLTEMSTRAISRGGKGGQVHRADKLTTLICRLSRNSGSFELLEP